MSFRRSEQSCSEAYSGGKVERQRSECLECVEDGARYRDGGVLLLVTAAHGHFPYFEVPKAGLRDYLKAEKKIVGRIVERDGLGEISRVDAEPRVKFRKWEAEDDPLYRPQAYVREVARPRHVVLKRLARVDEAGAEHEVVAFSGLLERLRYRTRVVLSVAVQIDDVIRTELDAFPDAVFYVPAVPQVLVRIGFYSEAFGNLKRVVRRCVINENDAVHRGGWNSFVRIFQNIGAIVGEDDTDRLVAIPRHRFDTIAQGV